MVPAGDDNKDIDSLMKVWRALSEGGAGRGSTLFCIGGGMVTDLGGFAAATFKRGIACVNVPTTLLGMVDAATGGKTGINLDSLKNEVGAFSMPADVAVIAETLDSLPDSEFLSGYAEMLKTALIADPEMYRALLDVEKYLADRRLIMPWVRRCIEVKTAVTSRDPKEMGERKILNFGHTAGHAFESKALLEGRPVPHGVAVAHGMLWELILSASSCGPQRACTLPTAELHTYAAMLKDFYPRLATGCPDIDALIALMRHDKKNCGGRINFTLLNEVGTRYGTSILTSGKYARLTRFTANLSPDPTPTYDEKDVAIYFACGPDGAPCLAPLSESGFPPDCRHHPPGRGLRMDSGGHGNQRFLPHFPGDALAPAV